MPDIAEVLARPEVIRFVEDLIFQAAKSAGVNWDAGPLPAGHTEVIQPGTLHVEYLGETSAYQSGIRYCAACAHAAGVAVYSLGTKPE